MLYWRFRYRKLKEQKDNELEKQERALRELKNEFDHAKAEHDAMVIELKKDEKKIYNLSKDNISEELYQKIVHDVGEGISVSDDNGYFLVFNPRLEEITGYTKIEANEHKNKLFLDKLYPDVELRAKVAEHIDQIPENHHYTNIKTLIKTKSGDDKPMLVSSTAITHKQKKYYLTAYRDVSEKPAVE